MYGVRTTQCLGFALALVAMLASATQAPAEWTRRSSSGPAQRTDAAMAFDVARERIVLFGGIDVNGTHFGDTWEWDGTRWTQRSSSGPSPRNFPAMAYDAGRSRVVLFGGHNGSAFLGDTWEWDGTTWTLRATSGPAPRNSGAMAYDTARGRVVLFGGNGGPFGDTWEWDGTAWSLRSETGPSPRLDLAMAYDPLRARVVLFGGFANNSLFGDTWEWDGTTWTERVVSGPAPRNGHTMAFDPCRRSIVLFGGFGAGNTYFDDTWEWDGATWTQWATPGPAPRASQAMAYDGARGSIVLFGGSGGPFNFGDTWESTWVAVAEQPAYGTFLFRPRCARDASSLTHDAYDTKSIAIRRGAGDRFFLASEGTRFSPLVVDDAVHINGSDAGLGPYSFQSGVPPFVLGVPIEADLVPLPAHEVTGAIPNGPLPVVFELLDTQREIYGNTAVYLVRDCGIWMDKDLAGQTRLNWVSQQVDAGGMQSDLDVVSGKILQLRADGNFAHACFLGTRNNTTQVVDTRPMTLAGDGYYYLVSGTCASSIGYGNSSQGPRQGLPPSGACP